METVASEQFIDKSAERKAIEVFDFVFEKPQLKTEELSMVYVQYKNEKIMFQTDKPNDEYPKNATAKYFSARNPNSSHNLGIIEYMLFKLDYPQLIDAEDGQQVEVDRVMSVDPQELFTNEKYSWILFDKDGAGIYESTVYADAEGKEKVTTPQRMEPTRVLLMKQRLVRDSAWAI